MPARTILLIVALTIIATVLVVYSLVMESKKQISTKITPQPTVSIPDEGDIEKTAVLAFDPSYIEYTSSSAAQTDIILDSKNHYVTGAQLELSFDPNVITTMRIATPTGLFWEGKATPVELYRNIDQSNGRISYIVGIQPTDNPVVGKGNILRLIFTINPALLGSGTQISILEKSLVTQKDTRSSVLDEKSLGKLSIRSAVPIATPTLAPLITTQPAP